MIIVCVWCQNEVDKYAGHVNRARKLGRPLYCNRDCAGYGRRNNKTEAQKLEEKRLYDIAYRERNWEFRKAQQQAYNESPAGRATQKRARDKKKDYHLAYCQTPEYRKWKAEYDRKYRAKKVYGEYWEAAIALFDLQLEVDNREAKRINGIYNKSQIRKRKWNQQLNYESQLRF